MTLFVTAKGQSNYQQAIDSGYYYYKKGLYQTAIKKYFAAEAFAPNNKDVVNDSVKKVFEKIEALRQEADNATKLAIKNANETKEALSKSKMFIEKHYFYDGKFALEIYKQEGGSEYTFVFMDTNGIRVEALGEWIRATQFSETDGFARVYAGVYTDFESDFLLDTTGQKYLAAYDLNGILRVKNYNKFLERGGFPENSYGIEAFVINSKDYLDVDIKDGTSLIDSILTIHSLKILIIYEADSEGVYHLASNLDKLPNLEYLSLTYTNLSTLSSQIGNLKDLRSLNLSANQLTVLPKEIGALKNLTTLDLQGNQLTGLPIEIGELKNLTTLNLGNNKLVSLPFEIGNLTNLTNLNLSSLIYAEAQGKLVHLPASIGELKNLKILDLGGNELIDLPAEILGLKNLTTLNLSSNKLISLPKEIGELKALKGLYLSGNKLTSLPKEIGELKNLRELILDNNQLTSLPKEIGELKNLRELTLDNNQLTSLPKEIAALKNLILLNLSRNLIPKTKIEEIKKLMPNCRIYFY